jgi:o-succinylbenzoate synthase
MAVASVEMALSELLGGTRTEVDVGVSIGIQPTTHKLVEVVSSYLNEGYRRVKLKIKPGCDIERVDAIRKRFPEILLQVDANSAYTLGDLHFVK